MNGYIFILVLFHFCKSEETNEKKDIDKILELKKYVNEKKKSKIVLVFNDTKQLDNFFKDMNDYNITIGGIQGNLKTEIGPVKESSTKEGLQKDNQNKRDDGNVEDKEVENSSITIHNVGTEENKDQIMLNKNIEDKENDINNFRAVKKEENKNLELDLIPEGPKTFCILKKYYKDLRDNEKVTSVRIKNIFVTKENSDLWNLLRFKKKNDLFIDETGYFEGVSIKDNSYDPKISRTGFFHVSDADEDRNVFNIKLLIKYIAKLRKISLEDLYKEECKLSTLDDIIYNMLQKNKEKNNLDVCICKDPLCLSCEGKFKVKKENINF